MSKRLQVLISDEMDARLRKEAARKGKSVGGWVRATLEEAFERGRATDPLKDLASLDAPTGDIDDMLAQIDAGRV